MKIYFEDGLLSIINHFPKGTDYIVDATYGVTDNINRLDELKELNDPLIIYTNIVPHFKSSVYIFFSLLQFVELFIQLNIYCFFCIP